MSALSDEEQSLLHRDREEHPECFYSTAMSSSCRAINGENKCEFIRKIFRQCPNENKKLISEQKDVTEGQGDGNELFDHQGSPARDNDIGVLYRGFDPFHERESEVQGLMSPFDFFRHEMLRPLEDFFGAKGFGFFDEIFPGSSRDNYFESSPPNNIYTSPPHYSFQPQKRGQRSQQKEDAKKQEKRDLQQIFDKYNGPEVEI